MSTLACMKMKEMTSGERPREKMLSLGPGALSDGELLAVLIRSGNGEENALDLSRKLLSLADGSLPTLFRMPVPRLCSLPGIGPCKAASLLAAFELGKRFFQAGSAIDKKALLTSRDVYSLMLPALKGLSYEECWALFLNNANYLTAKVKISEGGLDSTSIDVRKVVRLALEHNATGMVLVHNHPTGNPRPSKADIAQTENLHDALAAFRIDLVDHVVVSDDSFYSFAEERRYGGNP